MMLRRELPQLFELTKGPYRYSSIPLRRFYSHVHDCVFYFHDTTMYEDIMAVTESSDCEFRKYEMTRLIWLKNELNEALQRWDEDKLDLLPEEVAYGNELKDAVTILLDDMDQNIISDITSTKNDLWEVYGNF